MTEFTLFYNTLRSNLEGNNIFIYVILVILGSLFTIQIYYYLYYYISIVKRSKRVRSKIRDKEPISVVVIVRDDIQWVERVLPTLLSQKCSDFEVVVVDTGEESDLSDLLDSLKKLYTHLVVTRFSHNPKFPISNKMAYNVGIKSASNSNLLLTTTKARPISEYWLSEFVDEFCKSDVVIGYAGVERESNGIITKLIRLTRVLSSVRHLSFAINHKPYKGDINNLGFRKELYFAVKGFNFLNMNIGENDLFLQKIATNANTSVLISKNSTVIESFYGGLFEWKAQRQYNDYTFRYYPRGVKCSIVAERLTRNMFFTFAVMSLICLPMIYKFIVVGAIVVRLIVVMTTVRVISLKLGETNMLAALPIHDLIYPIDSFRMYIQRCIRPIKNIWR